MLDKQNIYLKETVIILELRINFFYKEKVEQTVYIFITFVNQALLFLPVPSLKFKSEDLLGSFDVEQINKSNR